MRAFSSLKENRTYDDSATESVSACESETELEWCAEFCLTRRFTERDMLRNVIDFERCFLSGSVAV